MVGYSVHVLAESVYIMFDSAWLAILFLLALRIGAIFIAAPMLLGSALPPTVRVALVFSLSVALAAGLSGSARNAHGLLPIVNNAGAWIGATATELALGATLGLGVSLAFASFSIAGRLLDIQAGFGVGQVFDPVSNTEAPILSVAFDQLALVGFFVVGGHRVLLRGLALSLDVFPLGRPWPIGAAFAPLAVQVAGFFSLGFSLAAPVAFCLLLVDLALGIVARNLPQMNMIALGIPVKIVVALIALTLWAGGMAGVVHRVYGSIFRAWSDTFELAARPA